jgi:hypothetical protein
LSIFAVRVRRYSGHHNARRGTPKFDKLLLIPKNLKRVK